MVARASPLIALVATATAALALGATTQNGTPKLVTRGYPLGYECPRAGEREVVDRWKMIACNCTSYVAWALQANGYRIDWFVPGAMDARNWPHVARLKGIAVGARPRPGSVAVWPRLAHPFGHVAFVTAVHGDGTFDVAEYNLPRRLGGRRFGFDRRHHVTRRGAVFLYVPDLE